MDNGDKIRARNINTIRYADGTLPNEDYDMTNININDTMLNEY